MSFPAVSLADRAAADTSPDGRRRSDIWASIVFWMPIMGVTVISKIAFPMGGKEILIGVPAIMGATVLGMFTGRLQIEPRRFMLYLTVVAIILAEQAFAAYAFSTTSLVLLLALHVPYIFKLVGGNDPQTLIDRYINLTWIIAICGIVQYFAQFAIGVRYAYPIEHFWPQSLLTHGYNYLNPLRYGSSVLKSNGLVLLEPSFYSQMMAIGFGLEAVNQRRRHRLVTYGAGFLVAFSGSCLIIMAAVLPTLMIAYKRYSLLFLLVIGGATVILFGESLGLGLFLERSREFESTESSGYQRYIGPAMLFGQYLWGDPQRWLFGLGAGMMTRMTPRPMFNAAETGWAKLILEFGLIGAGAYFAFLYTCIFRSRQPVVLRVSLAVMTLLSGILDSPVHGMILPLLVWIGDEKPRGHDARKPEVALTPRPPERPVRWAGAASAGPPPGFRR